LCLSWLPNNGLTVGVEIKSSVMLEIRGFTL
jgi:hypothetical protein